MDADGTLHNLRPIGRLELSGADPEPLRIGDTDFGGMWFSAEPESGRSASGSRSPNAGGGNGAGDEKQAVGGAAEHDHAAGATREKGSAATARESRSGGVSAAQDDQHRQAAAPAHDQHRQAAATVREQHGGGAGTTHDNHGQTAATAEQQRGDGTAEHGQTAGTAREPSRGAAVHQTDVGGPEQAGDQRGDVSAAQDRQGDNGAAAGRPRGAAEHLVVDMDITGLLNGVAITGDPSITVRTSGDSQPVTRSGLDPAAVRAEVAERVAAVVSGGGTEGADQTGSGETEAERPALSAADLEAIRWRLDGGTLREVVDDRDALRELGERLDGPLADEEDNVAKAGLLSVRAEVYRLLGELGMAAAASRLALAHAESAGDTQSMVIAQAELAHVLRLRGDHKEADRLFAKALGAAVPDALRSVVHENAGRSCFDQGRHMEALDHFARAVRLGKQDDTDLAERVGVCLEAVYIHVLRDGWGPYPRETTDILGAAKKPATQTNPALNEATAERPTVERD